MTNGNSLVMLPELMGAQTGDGLSKRELFALVALHAMANRGHGGASARLAVQYADDLIAQLNDGKAEASE